MRRRPWGPVLLCSLLFSTLLFSTLPFSTSAGAGEEPPLDRSFDQSPEKALAGLSGEKALALCGELAAQAMKGRKTAFAGGALVENWMLRQMAECGLPPADTRGAYLEPFSYGAANTIAPIRCAIAGEDLGYGSGYGDLGYTGTGKIEAEVVFCGYGISRPDLGWDDYAGIDVRGKVVLVLSGAPPARITELHAEQEIGAKSSTAADKGAVAFLLAAPDGAQDRSVFNRHHRARLPALWLSAPAANGILGRKGGSLAKLTAALDIGSGHTSFATGTMISLEVHAEYKPRAQGHNALGSIPGGDPALSEELILVTANMDHLGVDPKGHVFHGADDNASGAAVLLHLAGVLAANRLRPKRRIVFCAFGAREQGLAGSSALAAQTPFPGKVVAMLNLERVGQGGPVLRIEGGGAYPEMQKHLQTYLPEDMCAQVQFGRNAPPYGDHQPFRERGIPSFSITTVGPHPHLRTPADDMRGIQAGNLEAAARLVGTLAIRLANHPTPLSDPLGVASYLIREGPRFAMDDLIELPDKSLGLARTRMHAARMESGLAVLFVQVAEDLDPALAWKTLEALETSKGPVRYLLARSTADIERAYALGHMALVPRLCCARAVHADASKLGAYAAQGYRWLAPWATGTRRRQETTSLAPILAAAKGLKVALDAADLAEDHYAALRRGLGDRPLLFLMRAPVDGAALGPLTLPIVRFRRGTTWQVVIDATGGMTPPVVYSPRGLRQAEAIAKWGLSQPAGWEVPGSPQRRAIRAALGGHLIEWLARAER